jgi:hypothetical protein
VLNKIQPNNQGEYAMADKNILEQMLGHLVNDDKQKAEELFHEYVVAKSREIYESLIEAEMDDEEKEEEVDEASEEEKEEGEDDLEENFEDIAYEGDDEMSDMGGDPTDDLEGEMGPEEDNDMEDKDPEELFQDLDAIVDELQAKFDAMNGDDDMGGDDMGGMGDEEEMKDGFDLATVREYVEKVPAGHGAEKKGQGEKADGSATGLKFQKNDMGGTSANILSGKNGQDGGEVGKAGGQLKGSGLLKGNPQLQDGGNVNTPGAKNGNAFSTKEPGHGAEKAGSKESADKGAAGLFRGRR